MCVCERGLCVVWCVVCVWCVWVGVSGGGTAASCAKASWSATIAETIAIIEAPATPKATMTSLSLNVPSLSWMMADTTVDVTWPQSAE